MFGIDYDVNKLNRDIIAISKKNLTHIRGIRGKYPLV